MTTLIRLALAGILLVPLAARAEPPHPTLPGAPAPRLVLPSPYDDVVAPSPRQAVAPSFGPQPLPVEPSDAAPAAAATAPPSPADDAGLAAEVISRTRLDAVGPSPSSSPYQDAVDRYAARAAQAGLGIDDAAALAILNDADVRALLADQTELTADFVDALVAARAAPDWSALRLALRRIERGPREAYGIAFAEAAPHILAAARAGRAAWIDAVAARQSEAMLRDVTASLAAAAALADAQFQAGTIDRGTHAAHRLAYAEALRAQADAAKATVVAREALVRTLGLWGPAAAPDLPDRLPELPAARPVVDRAEDRAVTGRLDLVAARRAGASRAMAIAVRSEAREAAALLVLAYDVARHQQAVIVPTGAAALEAAQREYNGMLIGVYDLLAALRVQIEAGRGYVATLRDYWHAEAAFRAALGGEGPYVNAATSAARPEVSQ
jgi:hypothetical protein